MDVTALESQYHAIIDLAEQGQFADPAEGWTAGMVLAHLTVNDVLLLQALRDRRYDNAKAVDESRLRAQPEPLASLKRTSAELVAAAAALADVDADREIPVHIVDNGEVMVDQPLTVGRLLQIHADVHLENHRLQLESLRR